MIKILRLGHRKERDKRITTHVALAARALGADGFILSGERDDSVVESVRKVAKKWGGRFSAKYEKNWKKVIRTFRGKKVHLTMYGTPLSEAAPALRGEKSILVIVGAEKVPREVYNMSDYNVSVTSQPHSEVAALAVFLHELAGGRELERKFEGRFEGARLSITPSARGKKVLARK